MYYALIVLSVIMFGGCFALNDQYRQERGSGIKISLQLSLITALSGLIVLWIINGFAIQFTPFTLLISLIATVNSLLSYFCALKALGISNLSVYSLFSMLGGMLLPFFQGIFFYGEKFTFAKIVCLALICGALLLTLKKQGGGKGKGMIYYIAIFTFNGMSGVLSKLFASAPTEWKTMPSGEVVSSAGYSVLTAMCTVILSAAILLLFFRKKGDVPPHTPKSIIVGSLSGSVNKVANWILVFSLAQGIDSSVQYPMVTGGTMIVSTVISLFSKNKPSKRQLISIALAFLGMLALFVLPILFPDFNEFY